MLLLSTVQVTTRHLVLDSQKRRPGFCFTAPQLLQLRDLLRNRRLLSASIVSVECSFPPSNGQMATKQNHSLVLRESHWLSQHGDSSTST